MKQILCVFDAHVTPNSALDRFTWLGKFIAERKPDIIVQGGDFSSMESLSRWDKDKRLTVEGRRVVEDFDSAYRAWKLVEAEIEKEQRLQKKKKIAIWKPKLLWMEGNHELWLNLWIDRNAEFEKLLDFRAYLDLNMRLYSGVEYYAFKDIVECCGILFTHAPCGAVGPISSKYLSSRVLSEVSNKSMVYGHTHRRQSDTLTRYDSKGELKLARAENLGCFFQETPNYALGNTNNYWKGLGILHVQDDGTFDVEEWSLSRLQERYGNAS